MTLESLTIHDFRNIARAELTFGPGRWFLCGRNGQGKTSLLEAVGYAAALRSFRGADTRTLVRTGTREATLRYAWSDPAAPGGGDATLAVRLRAGAREAALDGAKLERLADLIGRFPSVVLSSHDLSLVRGAPADRRRFLDLVLASVDGAYFSALQRYQRALDGRNRLLRSHGDGGTELAAQLDSFELPLAEAAAALCSGRATHLPVLAAACSAFHARLARTGETLSVQWQARETSRDEAEWRRRFAETRPRDTLLQSTSCGPHRDDLDLRLDGKPAADFASEGQQRSIVLGLKLAQFELTRAATKRLPLLLADDVLGELDPERRERFWEALPGEAQVIATGTTPPLECSGWRRFEVEGGGFRRVDGPV